MPTSDINYSYNLFVWNNKSVSSPVDPLPGRFDLQTLFFSPIFAFWEPDQNDWDPPGTKDRQESVFLKLESERWSQKRASEEKRRGQPVPTQRRATGNPFHFIPGQIMRSLAACFGYTYTSSCSMQIQANGQYADASSLEAHACVWPCWALSVF